jgi:hypothetical protein
VIRQQRKARGWSQRDAARELLRHGDQQTPGIESVLRRWKGWEAGEHYLGVTYQDMLAKTFGVDLSELLAAVHVVPVPPDDDDEIAALELLRRVGASDVGAETVDCLELVVDDLAVAYPGTSPAELVARVRRYLTYVEGLMDARKTLAEHRRLIVIGGWLSLLAATCHIDLHQLRAASARLRAAAQLAEHAEHPEIAAWCLETQAWQMLTAGDLPRALVLAQGAQELAPRGSSAFIQATAQEARVWARLGNKANTYDALERTARLVSPLPTPERPEHHYRYDPAKSDAYVATTLSWLGDSAAEPYARQVLARLESAAGSHPRPRRAASARLDLALALLAANKPDEAAHATLTAVASGRLVPSNYWRAAEVITAVEARQVPEADELREAYSELCGSRPQDDNAR